MATIYAINDTIEVQIIGTVFTQVCMVARFFKLKTGPLDAAGIAALLNTNWCNNLRQTYTVDWRWTLYKMRRVDPTPKSEYEEWPSSQLSGLAQQHTLPPQLATLWMVRTGTVFAQRKGRIYHPAASQAYYQNGAFTSAGLSSMQSNLNSVKAYFKEGGTGVLEMRLPLYVNGQYDTFDPVTDMVLRTQHGVRNTRRIDY